MIDIQDIVPLEYLRALEHHVQESSSFKEYLKLLKELGCDAEEAEMNYNIFAKWFEKRIFEVDDDHYGWDEIKAFMDVSVVHYHTIMDRFLFGMNLPMKYDLEPDYEKILMDNDNLKEAADLRICSRLFVDWGVDRWPMLEVSKDFIKMMTHTNPFTDYKTKDILQAFPGFLVSFPRKSLRMGSGHLAYVMVSHEVDDRDNTEFISILLISDLFEIRVINTKSSLTINDLLVRHHRSKFLLSIIMNILFYLMAEPEDTPEPILRKNTGQNIIIGGIQEEVEIWRPGKIGANVKINHASIGKLDLKTIAKKRPHWRKGHWRHYNQYPKPKWIKPIFINKHLIAMAERH